MADKTQRGTSQRIREKIAMLSQLTHDISRIKHDAADEAQREREEAERSREEAERRCREAERGREEAERRFQEVERRRDEAERSREEAERGREQAERRFQEVERGAEISRKETERITQEAERRYQEAERGREDTERGRERAEMGRQDAEIGRQEAERFRQESELRRREAEKDREKATNMLKEAERSREEAERRFQEAVSDREEANRRSLEADRRSLKTERRSQEAERGREEAERRLLEAEMRFLEAERNTEEAERGRQVAERGRQEAQRERQEAERCRQEAERSRQEAESRVQDLERRLEERDCQDASIEGEKHWLVQRREIHMTNQFLGGGGWGEVKISSFRGVQVAAKVLYKDLQSSYYHRAFIREMNMASRVRHPNLVQFIGASMDEEMVILMELMPTSLRQHLTSNAPAIPSAAFRISVSLDIARALNYLHLMQPHPIIHRDISSANVLLEPLPNQKWRAKVTDYGSVNLQNRLRTENPGNPVYSAPEACVPSRQTTKMDVFSFGVLLIEMCTAQFPEVAKRAAMIRSIKERQWVDVIQQCIHQDQTQRPVMSQIIARLTSWQ